MNDYPLDFSGQVPPNEEELKAAQQFCDQWVLGSYESSVKGVLILPPKKGAYQGASVQIVDVPRPTHAFCAFCPRCEKLTRYRLDGREYGSWQHRQQETEDITTFLGWAILAGETTVRLPLTDERCTNPKFCTCKK